MDGWKPIEWITEPLNSMQLSRVYAHADAMMVNPVRDGLNLTAKEYVACQAARPGVLLLSPGAGAWEELGDYAVPIILEDLNLSAKYVNESLNMPERERQLRMLSMKTSLVSNQLCDWWSEFSTIPATATAKSARHNESFRPAGLG
jgi:trehalose 6-phosphate synthase